MKQGEINITFTITAGDREATERLAREMIRRAKLIDGVTLENITRYNTDGLIPSIDSISFSRSGWSNGVFETIQEPGISAARIPNIVPQPLPTEHISDCPILSLTEAQKEVHRLGEITSLQITKSDGKIEPLPTPSCISSDPVSDEQVKRDLLDVLEHPDDPEVLAKAARNVRITDLQDVLQMPLSEEDTEGKSELQHLMEMGFPLATEEQIKGAASEELMTPASMTKAGIYPQSWINTPFPPCSFYDNLLDRYDHYLSEDTKLPETGYQSASHLRGMITQLRYDTSQSLTKKHRWLGYIQGVMCAHGLIDVDTERDWTRGLFRGA